MKKDERILIIGNSGSGKTWLGKKLAEKGQIPLFHMDTIRWDQSGYEIRRSAADITKDLNHIQEKEQWILEGVFGKMAQEMLPFATTLIWLDLPWEECKNNLLSRDPQFDEHLNPQEKEKALETLIAWAAEHDSREDANSRGFFHTLYSDFQNQKSRLQNREDVTNFSYSFTIVP